MVWSIAVCVWKSCSTISPARPKRGRLPARASWAKSPFRANTPRRRLPSRRAITATKWPRSRSRRVSDRERIDVTHIPWYLNRRWAHVHAPRPRLEVWEASPTPMGDNFVSSIGLGGASHNLIVASSNNSLWKPRWPQPQHPPPSQSLTVSQLTAQIKNALEGEFPSVWVVGEISNYSRPQSGHSYFTLKDDQAQIRAVMWRSTASRLKFDLADGLDVVCHGHVDVYAPRGSYQLVVDELQPKGVGALELALRKLREKLAAEGLFDPARKRKLPAFPRRIAFVTSPTGAAVHDFLQVLRRRWRGVDVLIIPARVQGDGAAQEIVAGIRLANRLSPRPDVLVVGRGGGSLEDLWSFNEEPVVRAIAASKIPTVSAVGHEIDVTLSDLVADVRALTPSEAAERIVPAAEEISVRMNAFQQRLRHAVHRRVMWLRARLDGLATPAAVSSSVRSNP